MSDNCLGLNNGEPWGLQLTVELTVRSQMLTLGERKTCHSGYNLRAISCNFSSDLLFCLLFHINPFIKSSLKFFPASSFKSLSYQSSPYWSY